MPDHFAGGGPSALVVAHVLQVLGVVEQAVGEVVSGGVLVQAATAANTAVAAWPASRVVRGAPPFSAPILGTSPAAAQLPAPAR